MNAQLTNRESYNQKIRLSAVYLAIVMALIPLFNLKVGGRGLFLYLGVGIILTFISIGRYSIISGTRLVYFLFATYTLLTILWAPDVSNAEIIQCIKTVFFVISISYAIFKRCELNWFFSFQILMGIIIAVILCTTSSTMVVQGEWLTDTERSILVIGGVQIDPNYASILMIPAAAYSFKVFMQKAYSVKYKFIAMLCLLAIIYALLRSGSRGGMIAIFACILFYYIRSKEKTSRKVLMLAISVSFVIMFIPYLMQLLPDSIANRFTITKIISSSGAERTVLWRVLLENLLSNPLAFLFGHGYNAALDYLGIASHNYFLDVLYNGGVVQFLILLIFYWKLFKTANKNKNAFVQSILFGYILMSCSVSVGNNMFFWAGIVIAILLGEGPEIEVWRN